MLVLGASGDYSLAPRRQAYPTEFLRQMRTAAPEFDVRFATPSRWLDAVLPGLKSGAIQTPTMRGGTDYCWNAFWIQCPRVKTWFRRCEQQLQAAEMLATAASLQGRFDYPAQDLHHAWLLTCLNMDRNTLWGAAGGMVFEHEHSWDARDRFEASEELSGRTLRRAAESAGVGSDGVLAFNPLNWPRNDPVRLAEPVGPVCQSLPGRDEVLGRLDLPPTGIAAVEPKAAVAPTTIALPPVIETAHYRARIDAATGSLASLVLKPGGQEVLGGPANVIVAEYWEAKFWDAGNMMGDRAERKRLADSSGSPSQLTVTTGPLATVVAAESAFVGGGKLRRTTFFYHDSPRIEFETELHDLPDATVVVAEFPLGAPVSETRRGIPYGFSRAANGITPAVRWSHYQMAGAGVALLDQGLAGRELVGNTPLLFLYNAVDKYCGHPNAWLSGAGRHVLRYALLAHAGDFATARIPQAAWEFNNPPIVVKGCVPAKPVSFLQTSGNVVVEALRREEHEIEVRLAECLGRAGTATVTLNLPHRDAALTDLLGGDRQPLPGGPNYEFPVRPQQIVTMRFKTADAAPTVKPLTEWDALVPEKKREALRRYQADVKGHPPAGWVQPDSIVMLKGTGTFVATVWGEWADVACRCCPAEHFLRGFSSRHEGFGIPIVFSGEWTRAFQSTSRPEGWVRIIGCVHVVPVTQHDASVPRAGNSCREFGYRPTLKNAQPGCSLPRTPARSQRQLIQTAALAAANVPVPFPAPRGVNPYYGRSNKSVTLSKQHTERKRGLSPFLSEHSWSVTVFLDGEYRCFPARTPPIFKAICARTS